MKHNTEYVEAKLKFANGEFELCGSEEFVTTQIKEFKNVLLGILDSHLKKFEQPSLPSTSPKIPVKPAPQVSSPNSKDIENYTDYTEVITESEMSEYENIYAIQDNKIHIVCDPPGNSTAKKMNNLVLLYLYIKQKCGINEVSFSELRELCEKHGQFDSPNFSKHMKNQSTEKKYFIINGKGKHQIASIIRPGIKEAESLIENLKNNY